MALTIAERDSISSIIRALEVGSAGKFISSTEIERLTRIFRDACGFSCVCGNSGSGSVNSFQIGMRDAPFATLLKVVLCADAGGIAAGLTLAQLEALLAEICPPPVDLLTAGDFGLLGATTDTNSGDTIVDGDLGLSPGSAVVGYPPGIVLGTQHIADAVAAQAQVDAGAAYNALRLLTGTTLAGNIGGMTLAPGVYESATTLAISSGDLILDGGGDPCASFVFNVGSALTTTTGRKVVLVNGVLARNVFWTAGTSFTLGGSSIMRGTLIANASITAVTEAFIEGRLIARTGQVSTDGNIIELPI